MDNMRKLAQEIIDAIVAKDYTLFNDAAIYVDGECWTQGSIFAPEQAWTPGNNPYQIEYGADVMKATPYGRPDTITIVVDGALYEELNYGDGILKRTLSDIIGREGMRFEVGGGAELYAVYDYED